MSMETIAETTDTQYVNGFSDIENNTVAINIAAVKTEKNNLLITSFCSSDECCVKMFITSTMSIILFPFAICDIYFGMTDISCVGQHVSQIDLTMKAYLIASGIINIITTSFAIFAICISTIKTIESFRDEFNCCWNCSLIISKTFSILWLIIGCVLLWAYMNTSICYTNVHNYLFARFIIDIIFTFAHVYSGQNGRR